VAPAGRQQSWSPQVHRLMRLWAGRMVTSSACTGSNTSAPAVKRKSPAGRVVVLPASRQTNVRAAQPSCIR
jgi:hypothetical protein